MLDAQLFLANIKMVPEWTKFVYALPATRDVAAPKIPNNPAAEKLKAGKAIPAGSLKLNDAASAQVLALYAEILGRQPLSTGGIPAARFHVRTQTDLTPVEAIYALDSLAALHHLRFALVGDNKVKLVHESEPGISAGNN